uniref:Uncharacterized protein n=1 Tax=Syphacia muris TaxID=451379 RepID=A0A0N5AYR9_9BILA
MQQEDLCKRKYYSAEVHRQCSVENIERLRGILQRGSRAAAVAVAAVAAVDDTYGSRQLAAARRQCLLLWLSTMQ